MTLVKGALDAYAASVEKEWGHDRSKTIGASEIGQCSRRVWWTKRDLLATKVEARFSVPPKSKSYPLRQTRDDYGAALRGTTMENNFWYPAMKKRFGADLKFAGPRYQRTLADGRLSSTSDGLVVNQRPGALRSLGIKDIESDCFAVECKTIDPRVNLREEKAEHHFQTQVQLGLYRSQTKYRPVYNVISYIDASFWHEVDEYVIKFDPEVLKVAQKRADFIYAASRPEELPPEGWIAGGKECEYCPFRQQCDAARRDVPADDGPTGDAQFLEHLTQACREVRRFQDSEKEIADGKRGAQERVKELLREAGVRSWPKVVRWSAVKGRDNYDMKRLAEDATHLGLKLEDYCTTGDPSDRLEVLLRE